MSTSVSRGGGGAIGACILYIEASVFEKLITTVHQSHEIR